MHRWSNAMTDPTVLPIVATITTIQKFQGPS